MLFICLCNLNFGHKIFLKKHINTVHEKQKPFKCQICAKKFGQNKTLKQQISVIHKNHFNAKFVNLNFGQKSVLKQAIMFVHEKQKTPFKCWISEKEISTKSKL